MKNFENRETDTFAMILSAKTAFFWNLCGLNTLQNIKNWNFFL